MAGEDETRSPAEDLARRLIGEFGTRAPRAPKPDQRPERTRWSGPGPDARDPKTFSEVFEQLRKKDTWSQKLAEGKIFSEWGSIMGEQNAAKSTPQQLVDGVLHVQTESTAWATQLRLMQKQILEKIAGEVGKGVVFSLKITGPKAPSWRKGERHVRGRGPRDTYG
ncbi:DciA family protein [Segniliparus rugosus]|uniref:Uncharacterized protein n=1 Tax=Segniliparus rugosus (strain ATCC BAA-974 / DSM 45345 / CCUG 50838 / CIP 108380 / JCM 13579 / CDC 945) TaxID=679197 RepID=E5XV98_SEGRC|nr:DciA family protein [Segniliparus rugosus]EFV11711.1 hypothetical protein HMPREF9336_03420 [Segniliparus rugosus ATCC BAA-974]